MNWGFCMVGNEEAFCEMLQNAAWNARGRTFVYWEIGLGELRTFYNVEAYLRRCGPHQFEMTGVDVPGWRPVRPTTAQSLLHLCGSFQWFDRSLPESADFIFIDACHSYCCATNDFNGASKCLRPGGIACFHDVNPEIQGTEPQTHCGGATIGVRKACEDLGLLDGTRPGWKLIRETTGDVQKGGRGCLFFQKL